MIKGGEYMGESCSIATSVGLLQFRMTLVVQTHVPHHSHSQRMNADLVSAVALITDVFLPVMSLQSQESTQVRIQYVSWSWVTSLCHIQNR